MTAQGNNGDKARRRTAPCKEDTRYDALLDYVRDNRLPAPMEVAASWAAAFAVTLYYGYRYCSDFHFDRLLPSILRIPGGRRNCSLLPLVTEAKEGDDRGGGGGSRRGGCDGESRADEDPCYLELVRALKGGLLPNDNGGCVNNNESSSSTAPFWKSNKKEIIHRIRSDIKLRRLASKFAVSVEKQRLANEDNGADDRRSATAAAAAAAAIELYRFLEEIWLDLLRFPDDDEIASAGGDDRSRPESTAVLSLVVPAYRERGSNVAVALRTALDNCREPARVEVVVVDAGQCDDLRSAVSREFEVDRKSNNNSASWSGVKVVDYPNTNGGGSSGSANGGRALGPGRGQTLNFGASCSRGRILVFLHSDCLLPIDWDWKIRHAYSDNRVGSSSSKPHRRVHASAFRMQVDTTGLDKSQSSSGYPWGIEAVQLMANFRTSYYKMPYGDQAISMPASYFRYIGGFPNQPIMEDYDLMDYLRRRASVLPEEERLAVIPGPPCLGSARRWQKVGVLYVTLANALIVHRYTRRRWTPQDVFDYYYVRPHRVDIEKKEQ